jgi:hypothetical protein
MPVTQAIYGRMMDGRTKENHENLSQDSRRPSRDSKHAPSEYKSEI